MRFYGIADCKGLEAFLPIVPKVDGGWINRHRHAVVFLAEVSAEVADEVLSLIDEGEYEEALVTLKEGADSVSLARMPGAEKSWNMIPNPDLDPYS